MEVAILVLGALTLAVVLGVGLVVLKQRDSALSPRDIEQQSQVMIVNFEKVMMQASAAQKLEVAERLNSALESVRGSIEGQLVTNRNELRDALTVNRKELADGLGKATKDLEARFAALEGKVNERLEIIGQNVQSKLDTNLQEGFKHFRLVAEGLANAEKQLTNLSLIGNSVTELNNLLKLPHLRGNFGETALERLLNDFLPAGSYALQHEITPHSQERVDAVVFFPNVKLPIDSKFPREQVLPLFEDGVDPSTLAAARKTLSEVVKGQAKSIAAKYVRPDHGTTDLALMFLPSETLYFEVIRDGELWEQLAKMKVFPVSPNTLSISLQFIGRSMHYYEAAKNVQKVIQDLGKARKHFENFQKKFEEIGKGLDKAQDAYTVATRHLGTYRGSVNRLAGGDGAQGADDETSVALESGSTAELFTT